MSLIEKRYKVAFAAQRKGLHWQYIQVLEDEDLCLLIFILQITEVLQNRKEYNDDS
jgi:hypothetical protein